MDIGDALPLLLLLALALMTLALLSRQVSQRVQRVAYYTTRSERLTTFFLFLLLLPGIFVHECAHWLTARALGLRTGNFRVWPKIQGKTIGLGSVNVQRGALWQDSLVGMAPLRAGPALIALIGYQVFAANRLSAIVAQGRWGDGLVGFWEALSTADGALWAYLLFAIANAMMPSPSDREPIKPLLVYIAVVSVAYILLGLPLNPFAEGLVWLTPTLELVTSALLFTIVLDGLVVVGLWIIETLIRPRELVVVRSRSRR
ncbi:MAG TPA: hypothetical protein PKE45_10165 [Caldilineaceae bacterium]|nr:hypothetical protein [Caldilineaceae bacterium]